MRHVSRARLTEGLRRREFATVLAGMLGAMRLCGGVSENADPSRIRLVVSEMVAGEEANGKHGRLAMKSWIDALGRQTGITIESDRAVLCTTDELVLSIQKHTVDAFGLTTPEYMRVASLVDPGTIVLQQSGQSTGDEFLLIAHEKRDIRTVAGLRGCSLIIQRSPAACVGEPWLETVLGASKLGRSSAFFGRITRNAKVAQIVLPVYFQQVDACLIARRAFNVMCELNPQLAKALRVVAASPQLVSGFTGFHKDCPPARKNRFAEALARLHQSTYGQQVLTLFQGSRLVVQDVSALRGSVEMLTAWERLKTGSQR